MRLHTRWDDHGKRFIFDANGSARLTKLLRRLKGSTQNRKGEFILPEIYWRDAYNLFHKLGSIPKPLRFYPTPVEPKPLCKLLPLPRGKLRGYQIEPAQHMLSGPFLLGDDRGVGKTPPALAAMHSLLEAGLVEGVLILCPTSLEEQWCELASYFLDRKVHKLRVGETPKTGEITACTYTRARMDGYFEEIYLQCASPKWMVLLDEVHKIAGWGSQQFESVRMILRKVFFRIALSGTEVRNQPDSYFPIYHLIRQADLHRDEYLSYFQGGNGKWRKERLTALQAVRAQFSLRREKTEVLKELPEKTETPIQVPMKGHQKKLYNQMVGEEGIVVKTAEDVKQLHTQGILSKLIRLSQIAAWPGTLGDKVEPITKLEKWETLKDLIIDHEPESIIVWSYWPDVLRALQSPISKLVGHQVPVVYGATSAKNRDKARRDFMSGKVRVLLANPLAYGEGVNLQKGSVAIYWDIGPRKDTWLQSVDRIYRSGQELRVFIYYLLSMGTVEVACYEWLHEKLDMERKIIGKGKKV